VPASYWIPIARIGSGPTLKVDAEQPPSDDLEVGVPTADVGMIQNQIRPFSPADEQEWTVKSITEHRRIPVDLDFEDQRGAGSAALPEGFHEGDARVVSADLKEGERVWNRRR
jgi:hypothetical protein